MRKILLLLSFLFLPSCLAGQVFIDQCQEEFNAGGMYLCSEIELEDYVPQVIEDMVTATEEELQVYYPSITGLGEALENNGVKVTIIKATLAENCQPFAVGFWRCSRTIGGFNHGGKSIAVNWTSCSSAGTLAHEILHSVEWFWFNGGTTDHSTPFLFSETAAENSVERRVQQRVGQMCWGPEGVANDP